MDRFQIPTVSVAIETDNSAFDSFDNCCRRIQGLLDWMAETADGQIVEVFITYNSKNHDSAAAIAESLPRAWFERFKLLSMPQDQAHYYHMKNHAAETAVGDVVVFLDCDLTPVHGSFADLLKPLNDPEEVVSNGYAYFPADTLLSKSYSLFWYFAVFGESKSIDPYQFLASNVAVRRSWFLDNKYQTEYGGFKVCCYLLAQKLKSQGYKIHRPDVWFEHALWNTSFSFFCWRASVAGRDMDKKRSLGPSVTRLQRIKYAYQTFWHDLKRVVSRRRRFARTLGLSNGAAVVAVTAGVFFFAIRSAVQLQSACRRVNNHQEVIPDSYIT